MPQLKRHRRDNALAQAVGNRIRMLLGGESRQAFAPKIGISPNTLWDYMNGNALPSIEVMLKISEISGASLDWLIKGERRCVSRN
jgi:transcriptional regulator with XRE-family HTH domain